MRHFDDVTGAITDPRERVHFAECIDALAAVLDRGAAVPSRRELARLRDVCTRSGLWEAARRIRRWLGEL